jgi:hypothetical protein
MICSSAEQRLRVLQFWERHGLIATQEAFGVSRRTLFAWQAQLRRGGGQPHLLKPGSTRPKHLRRREWPKGLIEEIRRLRTRVSRFYQGRVQRQPRDRKPKGYQPELPGGCIAWDSIERCLHGLKRHLITCTDLASRFGFALGVKYLSSQQAYLAWQLHQLLFPATVRRVLSDNGQESARHFDSALKASGIVHWHTFHAPR